MEPARIFPNHDAADEATRQYYRGLTPEQRLDILLELLSRARPEEDATRQRLAPVYRIVELSQS
jgi:hypothetical protein